MGGIEIGWDRLKLNVVKDVNRLEEIAYAKNHGLRICKETYGIIKERAGR